LALASFFTALASFLAALATFFAAFCSFFAFFAYTATRTHPHADRTREMHGAYC
jgi:hypothetical protein